MDDTQTLDRWENALRHLTESRNAIAHATKLAVDNAALHTELFSLLYDRLERSSHKRRRALFYLLDSICQTALKHKEQKKQRQLKLRSNSKEREEREEEEEEAERVENNGVNEEEAENIKLLEGFRLLVERNLGGIIAAMLSDNKKERMMLLSGVGGSNSNDEAAAAAAAYDQQVKHTRSAVQKVFEVWTKRGVFSRAALQNVCQSTEGAFLTQKSNAEKRKHQSPSVESCLREIEEERKEHKRLKLERALRPHLENGEYVDEFEEMWERASPLAHYARLFPPSSSASSSLSSSSSSSSFASFPEHFSNSSSNKSNQRTVFFSFDNTNFKGTDNLGSTTKESKQNSNTNKRFRSDNSLSSSYVNGDSSSTENTPSPGDTTPSPLSSGSTNASSSSSSSSSTLSTSNKPSSVPTPSPSLSTTTATTSTSKTGLLPLPHPPFASSPLSSKMVSSASLMWGPTPPSLPLPPFLRPLPFQPFAASVSPLSTPFPFPPQPSFPAAFPFRPPPSLPSSVSAALLLNRTFTAAATAASSSSTSLASASSSSSSTSS
ncbi:MAGE family member L2 [Balamuthia mandrillaris]